MLCQPDDAEDVLAWAFANQESLLASAKVENLADKLEQLAK